MPTEPIDGLLDREFSRESARELVDLACPLLRELVDQATHVHARCESEADPERDIDLPAFLLFRHVFEMVDAAEVLLGHACVEPTVPILRSAFEASLGLDYLILDRDEYRWRALSWLYVYALERAERLERYDPRTEKGEKFRESWESELGEPPDVRAEQLEGIDGLRSYAEEERFDEIATEYERLTDSRTGRTPRWYALFGGPPHLGQLAERVDRKTEYDVYYRGWSAVVHGSELLHYIHGVDPEDEGHALVNPIRYPKGLPRRALVAANLLLHSIYAMLSHFRPNEDLEPWYRREIMERSRKLRHIKIDEKVIPADRW